MPNGHIDDKTGPEYRDLIEGLPSGAGIFYAYPDGRLEQVYLNEGYHAMLNDVRDNRRKFAGLSSAMAVYPDDRELLAQGLRDAIREDRMAEEDLRILTGDGDYKWVKVRANIAHRTPERVTLYVSYMDIDQITRAKIRLEASRRAMDIASARGRITLWLLDLDKRLITQEFQSLAPLDFPGYIENMPQTLIDSGVVHPADVDEFNAMYQRLYDGAEDSECTVRVKNMDSERYEWQHIIYARMYDESIKDRMAIGFAVNVDLQQQNRRQYEHELRLRNELMRGSMYYYQVNIRSGVIEEFRSSDGEVLVDVPCDDWDAMRDFALQLVVPEDREAVDNALFYDGLMKSYREGSNNSTVIYRRYVPGEGVRWMSGTGRIINNLETGELTALVYCRLIDSRMKDQLATESVVKEESNSVALLNVQSRLIRPCGMGKGTADEVKCFPIEELIETIIAAKVHPDDVKSFREFFRVETLIRALETESSASLQYRTIEDDGSVCYKRAKVYYLDNTHEDIVFTRRDVTDVIEEEQRQKAALQAAVDAANEANRAKGVLLSHISHDMRTPLNAILALSDPVLVFEADDAQKAQYLEEIHDSGKFLLGLINDILDMSRIENRKMTLTPQPYSLTEFSRLINSVVASKCREKGIDFVFSTEAATNEWVLLDKVRFNQVFINLLSNAVKFTPRGGKVEMKIEHLAEGEGKIMERFTVKDTGIGMSSEFLPRAFDSFTQEGRVLDTGERSGTGLGLSIVKQTVELMGGTVSVESRQGEGTTFTVDMEVQIVDAPESEDAVSEGGKTLRGKRVLLCEDHHLNTKITTALLIKRGCSVDAAVNGLIGLNMFLSSEAGYYDAILMDIRMPVMDGLEATQAIRDSVHPDAKTVPIIALSADAFYEDLGNAAAAGMSGHITKPIIPEQMYEMLLELLE